MAIASIHIFSKNPTQPTAWSLYTFECVICMSMILLVAPISGSSRCKASGTNIVLESKVVVLEKILARLEGSEAYTFRTFITSPHDEQERIVNQGAHWTLAWLSSRLQHGSNLQLHSSQASLQHVCDIPGVFEESKAFYEQNSRALKKEKACPFDDLCKTYISYARMYLGAFYSVMHSGIESFLHLRSEEHICQSNLEKNSYDGPEGAAKAHAEPRPLTENASEVVEHSTYLLGLLQDLVMKLRCDIVVAETLGMENLRIAYIHLDAKDEEYQNVVISRTTPAVQRTDSKNDHMPFNSDVNSGHVQLDVQTVIDELLNYEISSPKNHHSERSVVELLQNWIDLAMITDVEGEITHKVLVMLCVEELNWETKSNTIAPLQSVSEKKYVNNRNGALSSEIHFNKHDNKMFHETLARRINDILQTVYDALVESDQCEGVETKDNNGLIEATHVRAHSTTRQLSNIPSSNVDAFAMEFVEALKLLVSARATQTLMYHMKQHSPSMDPRRVLHHENNAQQILMQEAHQKARKTRVILLYSALIIGLMVTVVAMFFVCCWIRGRWLRRYNAIDRDAYWIRSDQNVVLQPVYANYPNITREMMRISPDVQEQRCASLTMTLLYNSKSFEESLHSFPCMNPHYAESKEQALRHDLRDGCISVSQTKKSSSSGGTESYPECAGVYDLVYSGVDDERTQSLLPSMMPMITTSAHEN